MSAPGEHPKSGNAADEGLWVAALYVELRALAQLELSTERVGHTLSATALVNEVYLKLSKQARQDGSSHPHLEPMPDRGVFFGLAAQAMRRILVDHARRRQRAKRGGGASIHGTDALHAAAESTGEMLLDPIELDDALTRLAVEHEQAARVVELRFFAGLPERTIAECMGTNERTVRRHWTFAKAWLAREMNPNRDDSNGSD